MYMAVQYIIYFQVECRYAYQYYTVVNITALKQSHLIIHPRLSAEAPRFTQPTLIAQDCHIHTTLQ